MALTTTTARTGCRCTWPKPVGSTTTGKPRHSAANLAGDPGIAGLIVKPITVNPVMKIIRFNSHLISLVCIFEISINKIVTIGVLSYLVGWVYLYYYFQVFNVRISSIAFDAYTVFIYAFFALTKLPDLLLSRGQYPQSFVATFLFLLILLVPAIDFRGRALVSSNATLRTVTVVAGIFWLVVCSRDIALLDAEKVASMLDDRPISLIFKEDSTRTLRPGDDERRPNSLIEKVAQAERNGGLALIWRNSDETVVLLNEPSEDKKSGSSLVSYRIANEVIASVRREIETHRNTQHQMRRSKHEKNHTD